MQSDGLIPPGASELRLFQRETKPLTTNDKRLGQEDVTYYTYARTLARTDKVSIRY
jgi:hypothetical protein